MSEAIRAFVLAACAAAAVPAAAAGQEWETLSLNRAYNGESALAVDLEYGAGTLTVRPAQSGSLYRAALRFDADAFEPLSSYENGVLRIGLDGEHVRGKHIEGGSLSLELSPRVPLDLELAFGAAEAELELGGLSVRNLELSTGASVTQLSFSEPNRIQAESISLQVGAARLEARGLGNSRAHELSVEGGVGEIDLDFSGTWSSDMSAKVEMGLGKLTLRLPRGLGVRIHKEGLLAAIDAEGLVKQGEVYSTPDFDSAQRKLTIDVDAAFNAIDVIWSGSLQTNAN